MCKDIATTWPCGHTLHNFHRCPNAVPRSSSDDGRQNRTAYLSGDADFVPCDDLTHETWPHPDAFPLCTVPACGPNYWSCCRCQPRTRAGLDEGNDGVNNVEERVSLSAEEAARHLWRGHVCGDEDGGGVCVEVVAPRDVQDMTRHFEALSVGRFSRGFGPVHDVSELLAGLSLADNLPVDATNTTSPLPGEPMDEGVSVYASSDTSMPDASNGSVDRGSSDGSDDSSAGAMLEERQMETEEALDVSEIGCGHGRCNTCTAWYRCTCGCLCRVLIPSPRTACSICDDEDEGEDIE